MAYCYNPMMAVAGPSGHSEPQNIEYDEDDVQPYIKPPLRILIPMVMIGEVIGDQGNTLRKICASTGAQVYLHRHDNVGASEVPVSIAGWYPEQCTQACKEILEVMQREATLTLDGDVPLKLLVRYYLSDGINDMRYIRNIMAQTGTVIFIYVIFEDRKQTLDYVIKIHGSIENKVMAETLISVKVRNNYNIVFSPAEIERVKKTLIIIETTYMHIPLYASTRLFGVWLNMAAIRSNTNIAIAPYRLGCTERIIRIVGRSACQDLAQFMIYQKLMMDGYLRNRIKIEVALDPATVGRVIGRGGRVVGAMQRLAKTDIVIPRRHELKPGQIPTATIIGDYHGIEKAQKRIRLKVEEYMIEQRILQEKERAMGLPQSS